jgi:hypothetical protein
MIIIVIIIMIAYEPMRATASVPVGVTAETGLSLENKTRRAQHVSSVLKSVFRTELF